MKNLLLASLVGLGLLLPTSLSASTSRATFNTEITAKKSKSKKSRKTKRKKTKTSKSYSKSKGCTYNGHELIVGPRGGCYYYSGNSKEYVDRSYCSGCN